MNKESKWIDNQYVQNLVSVIIPTFNRSDLLKQAIESVIDQSYRPIECIVIDDGSSEDIKSTVGSLMPKVDERFYLRYYRQKNSGSQVARNRGTIESSGEYIQYLDSDDLLYPGKLTKQIEFLAHNYKIDGVFGDWDKGTIENSMFVKAYANENLIDQFLSDKCIANFSFLMRRGCIKAIGPWDENIKRNQEIDYHLRGVIGNQKFDYLELNCGLWREHSGERIVSEKGIENTISFLNKWVETLSELNILSANRKIALSNQYLWSIMNEEIDHNQSYNIYIHRAFILNEKHPYFNTPKMKLLRLFLGSKVAIKLWYKKAKKK